MDIPQSFQIAKFALSSKPPFEINDQLKKHLLDSVGSLIHACRRPTIKKLAEQIKEMGSGNMEVPVIGSTSADHMAQLYTALIRYPDFMDNFLGKEATCHPSDNIGALLAAGHYLDMEGSSFLEAMAVGYEIECRLIEELPVMVKGFDHTMLLSVSIAAELSRVFGLNEQQAAHAIAISIATFDPLAVTRASYTYEWKGFVSSFVAFGVFNIVLMAKHDITGPLGVFEGPKGIKHVFDMKLDYDWTKEDFSLIKKCILKSYNSEVHTQSAVEAAMDLKKENNIDPAEIESIDITTFLTCYNIVGGGTYGDRKTVASKEQADHSLPYVISAALLDDELYPGQFLPERISAGDVQELLKKVNVHTELPLHKPNKVAGLLDPHMYKYPDKVYTGVEIKLKNGEKHSKMKTDYDGFFTRPLSWVQVEKKFRRLADSIVSQDEQDVIIRIIKNFENHKVKELTNILKAIR